MNTLEKINKVQEIRLNEIERFFNERGYKLQICKGSTVKIKLNKTVITLHCMKGKLKFGVVRTIKNQLKIEGIL